jgi:hypothetical protein
MPVNPEMRASDADRDRVVEVLRAAAAEGRLTIEELDQRVAAALSSRTLGALAALTADLGPGAGVSPAEEAMVVTRIDQHGGSVRRAGRWVVPPRLEMRPSWCDVTLDFTDAVIMHDTLLIDMKMRGGSLTLVVGPGIVVDADALTVRYADVEIDSGPQPGVPVVLRVRLAGRMRYGWIGTRRVQADSEESSLRAAGCIRSRIRPRCGSCPPRPTAGRIWSRCSAPGVIPQDAGVSGSSREPGGSRPHWASTGDHLDDCRAAYGRSRGSRPASIRGSH